MTTLLKYATIIIMEKELVSLDIFDTALFRKVFLPTDIFKVIDNKIGHGFYNYRTSAQSTVALKNHNYNLIDIYNAMPRNFSPKEEILAEMQLTEANPYILNLYNSGYYDFIFISDMYLPSVVLEKLLENAGYKNPQVFVSCEEKALKGTGELFLKVQEKLGRKIYKHYGDNYSADIKGAQKAGIPNVEYVGPPIYVKDTHIPVLRNPILRKKLIDNEEKGVYIADKIGYTFAPLVLSFLEKLLKETPLDKTIFFNARDSFLPYIIAKYILKTDRKVKYCRFSRKSVHLANMKTSYKLEHEVNKSTLSFLLTLRVKTLRDIIDTFNLDMNRINSEVLKEIDTDIEFDPNKQNILKNFFLSIQDLIRERALQEKANIKKYIEYLGMKDGDVFVDLGHYGSMQSNICKMFNIDLKGRYIHTFKNLKGLVNDNLEKTSFLPKDYLRLYTGIAEIIFTEPVGTVTGYSDTGVPILTKDSYFRKSVSKSLIRGVIRGVKYLIENNIKIYYEDCITLLDRFFKYPTLEEASFANQELFENGSIDEESVVWFNKKWIKAGKIRQCFNRSYWKTAFMVILENNKDYKSLSKELPKCPI